MPKHHIFAMPFAKIYLCYVQKAERITSQHFLLVWQRASDGSIKICGKLYSILRVFVAPYNNRRQFKQMVVTKDNADKFTIRKAMRVDLPVLVDFLAKLALHVAGESPHTLKTEERKRLMAALRSSLSDPNKLIIVAESTSARLVGMGYFYTWRNQGIWEQAGEAEFKSGIIDDVWVEPDFRKLGVFSAILLELVSFAESHDVDELTLEYAASNKEAAAIWTKLGFKPTGVRAAAFTTVVLDALAKRR